MQQNDLEALTKLIAMRNRETTDRVLRQFEAEFPTIFQDIENKDRARELLIDYAVEILRESGRKIA